MKTGFGDRPLTRASTGIALTAVLALPLVLSGCDDHSPVAAPTSTLPAGEASQTPSPADAEPNIPAYGTDLDLSAEETKAVEGALVAFDGFFRSVNSAYSGNFESTDDFPKYASGDALESINGDAKVVEDGTYEFSGSISPSKVSIYKVGSAKGSTDVDAVTVDFCFDLTKWSLRPKDEVEATPDAEFVTMEHLIKDRPEGWRVTEQSLKEKRC